MIQSYRLIQGAENSILELKDTIASFSMSLHGKEQHIAELNSLLGSKEMVMLIGFNRINVSIILIQSIL